MRKSLGLAFVFSLIVFLALNFLFIIIGYSIAGVLDLVLNPIETHPTFSVYLIVYASQYLPWEQIINSLDALTLGFKIFYIGGLISFAIASIVAGLIGGSIGKSFGGWLLTVICSSILFIIIISIDDFNLNYISFTATLIDGIITIIIASAVNLLLFGAIAIIIALIAGRS